MGVFMFKNKKFSFKFFNFLLFIFLLNYFNNEIAKKGKPRSSSSSSQNKVNKKEKKVKKNQSGTNASSSKKYGVNKRSKTIKKKSTPIKKAGRKGLPLKKAATLTNTSSVANSSSNSQNQKEVENKEKQEKQEKQKQEKEEAENKKEADSEENKYNDLIAKEIEKYKKEGLTIDTYDNYVVFKDETLLYKFKQRLKKEDVALYNNFLNESQNIDVYLKKYYTQDILTLKEFKEKLEENSKSGNNPSFLEDIDKTPAVVVFTYYLTGEADFTRNYDSNLSYDKMYLKLHERAKHRYSLYVEPNQTNRAIYKDYVSKIKDIHYRDIIENNYKELEKAIKGFEEVQQKYEPLNENQKQNFNFYKELRDHYRKYK